MLTPSATASFATTRMVGLYCSFSKCDIYSTEIPTKKFRERFCRPKHEEVTIELREPLTDEELNYLKLVIEHNTKKQIIEKLNILNVNFCNYIAWNICCKLNARNMTQAVYHAGKLGIV